MGIEDKGTRNRKDVRAWASPGSQGGNRTSLRQPVATQTAYLHRLEIIAELFPAVTRY